MCVSTIYTPLIASRRPSTEQAYFFMMNCLLYSRMEAGYPTNNDRFDEDVNVYLASLLTSIIYPRDPRRVAGLLAESDAALSEAANAAAGPREKCLLYRSNADHLLIALGVFRNARMRRPDSAPRFAPPPTAFIGRGKTYYSIARSYEEQARRGNTSLGEVLGKLSSGFERYLAVLSLMGGEHLNIFKQISDGEIFHLERASRSSESRADLALRYDRFLDLYSGYLRTKSPRNRRALAVAAKEIREIDPSFTFDVEERERVSSL